MDFVPGRRRFLTILGATVASGAIHFACSSSDGAPSGNPIAGTNVRDVPVGSLAVARPGVLLGRDAGGLYAMTAVCTHNQCDMTVYGTISGQGLTCMCHGSTYSPTGERTGGPAMLPLKHFRVTVAADGSITIDSGTVVDASVRTAVPG